jgi:hypothetical protein
VSQQIKTDRLPQDFILKVCWAGTDHSQYCRYVRSYKGRYICAKGTPAGDRHDKRMQRYLETFDRVPMKLSVPDNTPEPEPDPEAVLFDSGEDAKPDQVWDGKPVKRKVVDAEMRVHTGDNCSGRADEFAWLFEDNDKPVD